MSMTLGQALKSAEVKGFIQTMAEEAVRDMGILEVPVAPAPMPAAAAAARAERGIGPGGGTRAQRARAQVLEAVEDAAEARTRALGQSEPAWVAHMRRRGCSEDTIASLGGAR